MLGNVVYENHGWIVGMKRLPNGAFELAATLQGTFLGEESEATWTGETESKPDGTLGIKFHGIFNTKSGLVVPYSGIANGRNNMDGSAVYTGGACFNAPSGKHAKLNGIAVIFEVHVDNAGFISNKGWEWE